MPEAIEADSYFTSGGFTMDVILTGTNDVTSENILTIFSSTVEASTPLTYTNSDLTYNQVSGPLLSDIYFQTFDQSFSVIENLSSPLSPSLPCSSSGSTAISFSIAGYNNGLVPSFISIDSNSGVLTVFAKNVDADTDYSFYINSVIQGVLNPIQKLIKVTVIDCKVTHCSKCINSNGLECSECNVGYSISSNKCIIPNNSQSSSNQTTSQVSETAKSMRSTVQIATTIITGVVVVSSFASISSMSSIWLMVHQIQIFFLLLITGVFIPTDVISIITGMKFALFPFEYILPVKIGFHDLIANKFDFGITNSNLELLDVLSESTIFNIFPMVILLLIIIFIHFLIALIVKLLYKCKYKGKCSCILNISKIVANKIFLIMTFGYYIRSILEVNQYILISSINEISNFNTSSIFRVISISSAFIFLILCILLICLVAYLSLSSYERIENEHYKIGEFFQGVKNGKFKIYSLTLLIRRFAFVTILINFSSKSSTYTIGSLCGLQVIYLVFLIILRPFEEIKCNLIEILNEIYFTFLFSCLIFFDTEIKWNSSYIRIYSYIIFSNNCGSICIIIIDCTKNSILKLKEKCNKKNQTVPINIDQSSRIETQLRVQTRNTSRINSEIAYNKKERLSKQREENKYSIDDSIPIIRFERNKKL